MVLNSMFIQNFCFLTVAQEKNLIIFGANKSSSVRMDNNGKDMLILDEGPTQGLDDTTLAAEAKYPVNFT